MQDCMHPYASLMLGTCTIDLLDYVISLQVAILCGHHKVSAEISGFDLSQVGKYVRGINLLSASQ